MIINSVIPRELYELHARLENAHPPNAAAILAELDRIEAAWGIFEIEYGHILEIGKNGQVEYKAEELVRRADTAINACMDGERPFVEEFIVKHLSLVAIATFYRQMMFVASTTCTLDTAEYMHGKLAQCYERMFEDEDISEFFQMITMASLAYVTEQKKGFDELPKL